LLSPAKVKWVQLCIPLCNRCSTQYSTKR